MKKLNRKGFTLIELLAVIVIMAIILVVTVPTIINSISDARANSLHNLAVSVARNFDTFYAQDILASGSNKQLGNIVNYLSDEWRCIEDFNEDMTNYNGRSLSDILGLSDNDIVIFGAANMPTDTTLNNIDIVDDYCSAIRIVNGSAEVILIARQGGKFFVSDKIIYAYSKDPSFGQN